MNKRKQKKTSLKSAVLLLLLMAVLLITSSYAWFTANQTVTVSALQVKVEATNGLQISADAINWKATLSNSDLTGVTPTYSTNTNQIPTAMAPVSTTGNVTDGLMDMFYGTVGTDAGGNYTISATKETDTRGTGESAGNYIAFDLFLKVDAVTPIYMTANSKVEKVGDVDQGLQNASRVAFVIEGNAGKDVTDATTIQALKLASGTALIWEPNYDTHTTAAVKNASDTYGITTTTTGGSLLPYYGIKAEILTSANEPVVQKGTTPNASYFATVTPTYSTTNGFTDQVTFTTLQPGTTKIRVYMWVEGQDVDCENGASGTDIAFTLQFTSTVAVP